MAVTDDTRPFFFVHVMKTGGTSFVFHLLRNFEPRAVYPHESLDRADPSDVEPYASVPHLLGLTEGRRAQIRVFAGHFPYVVSELLGLDPITLTLLRDPVDRTISVLKHFKRLFARYADLSLDEIYEDDLVFRLFVENFQTKVFAITAADHPRAFVSGLSYREIFDRLGEPRAVAPAAGDRELETITVDADRLAGARANLANVSVVGLNERYGEFVQELRTRFGWWPEGLDDRGRANVSAEPWPVSAALRARVARDNAFDLELYEYAKELVAARRS